MKFRFIAVLFLSTLGAGQLLFGSAFAINEGGTRAQGMAGAFTAIADDGSAIFFNPAGMAFQKRTQMEMDALAVVGLFRYFPSSVPQGVVVPEKGYSGLVKPKFIPVANLYLVKPISKRVTFGFGMYAPFGLAANFTNFNDGDPSQTKFPGRYAGSRGQLQSIWIQPTVSYRLAENTSVAFGVAAVYTHLFLERSILNPLDDGNDFGKEVAKAILPGTNQDLAARSIGRLLPEGRFRAAVSSWSPGFSAGFMQKFHGGRSSFGFNFRSAVVHHLEGDGSFAFLPNSALAPFLPKDSTIDKLFPNQKIRGMIPTPATYSVGVATPFLFNSLIAVDFMVQDFRRFKDLVINFSQTTDTATPAEQREAFDFRNSYVAKIGIEKNVKKIGDIRGGYSYDYSPVPDKSVGPIFPDSSRNNFTVGLSHRLGNMELSLFYQAMFFKKRTTDVADNDVQWTNGKYDNFAHLAGAGMRIYLGKEAK
jgi:long-chain fatty acid transport protein